MFQSAGYLKRKARQGDGQNRFKYIQSLVNQFQAADAASKTVQILAHLANFAYDPINYDFLWELNVHELFLDILAEYDVQDNRLIEFSAVGICNFSSDLRVQQYVLDAENDAITLLVGSLKSRQASKQSETPPDKDSEVNTITAVLSGLLLLISPQTKEVIVTDELRSVLEELREKWDEDVRVQNLCELFIQDYFQ
ncbi:hypothetical protein BJ742DRAFT_294439 [Cladochytrium replicatum]|nr:hypothetical protein BJ742DRAFT_294439 [Cladochytrium replicatum]